ncbi:wall-associated receptor kinase 2-like isoform X2 [Actinidia eriantha]|uniref:wall-associated receptor kinase 2-like isoform X2 n=1 Tax=Actinidia eriantha TaxID=165200 RepID=UPI00258DAA2A|nr:wall-associated receptor kinase 2-like isoform X2 [Actinidia eriantha]
MHKPAKSGCQDKCGSISIPYPFGTTENCYYDEGFLITCNETFSPPKLFLESNKIEVRNISVDGHVHAMKHITHDCYDQFSRREKHKSPWMNMTKFTISSTKNKFTGIGCDTYATIKGYRDGKSYMTGCMSICTSTDYVRNGWCSGIGCCQTSIPEGLNNFKVYVGSYHNHTRVWNFSPCGYAFVVEENEFNFSSYDLTHLGNETELPIVLDWAIENVTCGVAKNSIRYACMNNTECHDITDGTGYRCSCLEGYKGNPYLPGTGCQGVCSSVGSLFLMIAIWWLRKVMIKRKRMKRKEKFFRRNGGLLLQQQLSSNDGHVEKTKLFNEKDLDKATDHYNEDRIIGHGSQGTVYKGMLSDGRIVAVKRAKEIDEGKVEQFINEVVILSQINHRNVVKLLGCCLETDVPLLVSEFISNGTLFQRIHDPNDEFLLTWELRLRIATEVAGALSYLHCAASVPIYHRDVKSTNILLDDKYRAKVSDFGISRSVGVDKTHLTTLVQGTFGYLYPEYFQSSQFTEKSDVYSFGVVLVELLSGQKPISSTRSQESWSLATRFIQSMEEDHLFEILDPKIIKADRKEEIVAVAQLAHRCLNLNGKKRPPMKEVAGELDRIRKLQQNSVTQPYYEIVENNTTRHSEARDVASSSTGTESDSTSSIASSFDATLTQPTIGKTTLLLEDNVA